MKFKDYYEARDIIVKIMKEDLIGPLDKNEIIENELPVSYYLLGKLFPQNVLSINSEKQEYETEDDFLLEEETELFSNSVYPSAMGITIALGQTSSAVDIEVEAAKYIRIEEDVKNERWKRDPISRHLTVDLTEFEKVKHIDIEDGLCLDVRKHVLLPQKVQLTITLINQKTVMKSNFKELSKATYFQPRIIVTDLSRKGFLPINNDNTITTNKEAATLEMLYRSEKNYATGHGCAASWEENDTHRITKISSEIMPSYEVLQMKAADCFDQDVLSMGFLGKASAKEILTNIKASILRYEEWISLQEKSADYLGPQYLTAAKKNLELCRETGKRLYQALESLRDPVAFQSFQYANQTMFLHLNSGKNTPKWYPFQLAFFLMEIESIIHTDSEYRNIVDLLWFPTGGGKTEAYLAISAFSLFYRKLKYLQIGKDSYGVNVIMRYTLRLLSMQQFERASRMICAAESIRKDEGLGTEPFTIGLWVGDSMIPNKISDVEEFLKTGKNSSYSNPVQVKKCPWCGNTISESNYYVDKRGKRLDICCSNEKCRFKNGLPILLIDEDIYCRKPSFLIGTIDKFAQIAYRPEASALLGVRQEYPVELIIQDELHLISGPLGTITGIYEAAFGKLCEKDGISPKVIASTATIRNADHQIRALYGRGFRQFPPQGIDYKDSFFAELSSKDEKPGRLYLGILPIGVSKTMAFTRVMGALLFASRYLTEMGYSDEVVDSFWTETAYFNTLKELGGALIRIVDSVQDRYNYLRRSKFAIRYKLSLDKNRFDKYYELTSRNTSAELGDVIQNALKIPYKKNGGNIPYDVILASNMLSVGIDISRLGTMIMVGQPLKNAEYIQATSRVGRSKPGIVFALYNGVKTRDRSCFEQFVSFHAGLYKYVEPTSATPFADRARDRALQALYVILCRYMISGLYENEDASNFTRNIPHLEGIRKYIIEYAEKIDPEEIPYIINEIEEIETEWEERTRECKDLVYYNYNRDDNSLFKDDYDENSRFRMMNSMRSVEPSVTVYMEE